MKNRVGILVVDYDLYLRYLPRIKNEIEKGNCEIYAITNGWMSQSSIGLMDGFKYYDMRDFIHIPYNYLIIASDEKDYKQIKDKIKTKVSCDPDSIFSINIFGIVDFDFEQYTRLVKSRLSIVSCNCWGGITYSNLFHEFLSPTINLRFG